MLAFEPMRIPRQALIQETYSIRVFLVTTYIIVHNPQFTRQSFEHTFTFRKSERHKNSRQAFSSLRVPSSKPWVLISLGTSSRRPVSVVSTNQEAIRDCVKGYRVCEKSRGRSISMALSFAQGLIPNPRGKVPKTFDLQHENMFVCFSFI